jgi:hypothetical protein
MGEVARDRHHELRNAEHFGAFRPLPGRVARYAARDHAHQVPPRHEGRREPHRRYRRPVVVDIERVVDQRDDHPSRRASPHRSGPAQPVANLFPLPRLIDLAQWAAAHGGGVRPGTCAVGTDGSCRPPPARPVGTHPPANELRPGRRAVRERTRGAPQRADGRCWIRTSRPDRTLDRHRFGQPPGPVGHERSVEAPGRVRTLRKPVVTFSRQSRRRAGAACSACR